MSLLIDMFDVVCRLRRESKEPPELSELRRKVYDLNVRSLTAEAVLAEIDNLIHEDLKKR
jgi:hypothetical protein